MRDPWVEIWRWTTNPKVSVRRTPKMINFERCTSGSISANSWTLDVQTSLGVSFWKCCLSLQLFFFIGWFLMIFFSLITCPHFGFSTYLIQIGPKWSKKSSKTEDFDGKSRNLRSLRLFFQTLEPLMVLVLPVKS